MRSFFSFKIKFCVKYKQLLGVFEMKKICLLTTGGTIASAEGAAGLIPQMDGAEMLRLIPALTGVCQIDCQELMNIDSSNLQPEHWGVIARKIVNNYDLYDGFVISHGTDTMAYSAAALTYMLKNLAKPVVFTGSQRPIGQADTDGKANLLAAFRVAAEDHFGVYLVFANTVIHGLHAKKLYTKHLNAFGSINAPIMAHVAGSHLIWQVPVSQKPAELLALRDKMDQRVFVLTLTPGIQPQLIDMAILAEYRGIIIEGFGAGGVPNQNCERNLLPAIERALKAGVVVACVSQCIYDGTYMDCYEVGILAERMGVVSAGNMTLEALLAKFMLALGECSDPGEIRRFLRDNTYGEVI